MHRLTRRTRAQREPQGWVPCPARAAVPRRRRLLHGTPAATGRPWWMEQRRLRPVSAQATVQKGLPHVRSGPPSDTVHRNTPGGTDLRAGAQPPRLGEETAGWVAMTRGQEGTPWT